MYTWTLSNGVTISHGDEIIISNSHIGMSESYGGNPRAFFSRVFTIGGDMRQSMTIRYPNYPYGDDINCHFCQLENISPAFFELKYDPNQQGDKEDDI